MSEYYEYYPDILSPDFYKKIFLKKEFNKNKIQATNKTPEEACDPRDYTLMPQQIFLKNFISPDTPYNGILIFHGVGVGKTCSAISIAEQFKDTVRKYNKKILVILGKNIRNNFRKQIYDLTKENIKKKKDDIVQCTGNTYMLSDEYKFLTRDQKQRKIKQAIMNNYEFWGYEEFANQVMKVANWDGSLEQLNTDVVIQNRIKREYSNTVIIIDEVQHVKIGKQLKKKIPPILEAVIKYASNVKLIMMSATPMHDRPEEIVFLLNLLLQNDRRDTIKINDIFDKKGNLINPDLLRKISKGYISYLRGESPLTFPIRLYPKYSTVPNIKYTIYGEDIPPYERIKYLRLIECKMSDFQYKWYSTKVGEHDKFISNSSKDSDIIADENADIMDDDINKDNEISYDHVLTVASNIIYPTKKGDGVSGRLGISRSNDGKGGIYRDVRMVNNKRIVVYKYQTHVISDIGKKTERPFFDKNELGKYSAKFATALDNLINAKGGICFVYSFWKPGGVIPFSLILEQNGIMRYESSNERQLLDYSANTEGGGGKSRPICYLCGKDITAKVHLESSHDYHKFKIARYIVLTGDKDITKIDISKAVELVNSSNNNNGEEIKIILGTGVISEGLDFQRIRQVHILEPWYNLSMLEQIIGRAVRNCSHIKLPRKDRNVEIFLYASTAPTSEKETIDLKKYRISEVKDRKIKAVERVLKESAVDCVLNKSGNIFSDKNAKVEKISTTSGNILNIRVGDHPYTRICDYDKCEYKCNWEPEGKILKINDDTYTTRFANEDINNAKKMIKQMFREAIVFKIDDILDYIEKKDKNINKRYIYKAVNDIIVNKEPTYDKYDREGYVIYKGKYYIYQPKEIDFVDLPLYYRDKPLKVKPKMITLTEFIDDGETVENDNKNDRSIIKKINDEIASLEDKMDETIKRNGIKNYQELIIAMVLEKLNINLFIKFAKKFLKKYIDEKHDKYDNYIYKYMTPFIIKFKGEITGFAYCGSYFCLKNGVWVKCNESQQLLLKTPQKDRGHKYSLIYGVLSNNKEGNPIFQIADKTRYLDTMTVKGDRRAKRSEITGRLCYTFDTDVLEDIRQKIGMKNYKIDSRKTDTCSEIELFLRYMNSKGKLIWFENQINTTI